MYKKKNIGIVIPYYNDSKYIKLVTDNIPEFVDKIIIVDDKSQEPLPEFKQGRIEVIKNNINMGVGGATVIGMKRCQELNIDIVVKLDADNQMDINYLASLLDPIISLKANLCKGNRFYDLRALKNMPFMRRIGNLGISFLSKIATGYWHIFDPTNGYLAIDMQYLKRLDLNKLNKRFFFETSLIAELYFSNTKILDIPMEANYQTEKSSMNIWKELVLYPFRFMKVFFKRILFTYFLYDFNMASIYIMFGLPLFLFGVFFGTWTWITNASRQILTPTGTIMLITLSIIIGFQLILQAIHIDIGKSPQP